MDLHLDRHSTGLHNIDHHQLLLELVASVGWQLQSFDIKAAFLQGKPQKDRILAIEPVPELIEALQLRTDEVCKLEKRAYGLVDAPYLWYTALTEELVKLGFEQSPLDPCQFLLRHHQTNALEGILGIHVDDGICGGSSYFKEKINQLEKTYPFGSKKIKHSPSLDLRWINNPMEKSL